MRKQSDFSLSSNLSRHTRHRAVPPTTHLLTHSCSPSSSLAHLTPTVDRCKMLTYTAKTDTLIVRFSSSRSVYAASAPILDGIDRRRPLGGKQARERGATASVSSAALGGCRRRGARACGPAGRRRMSLDPAPGVRASWCGGWGLPCAVRDCIEACLARCCSWLCRGSMRPASSVRAAERQNYTRVRS